ncbi:MAG: hypothetical protein ACRECV_05105 [Xanthobacteraceae bacterium]
MVWPPVRFVEDFEQPAQSRLSTGAGLHSTAHYMRADGPALVD